MKKLAFLLMMFVIVLSYSVSAQSIMDGKFIIGDGLSINNTKSDNLYVLGGTVDVLQNINGDLLVTGGQVSIEGVTFDDVAVVGDKVNIEGNVGGDARILAGDVSLNSAVFGDFIALASNINVKNNSVIGRDVVILGNTINFEGIATNKLVIRGNDVVINGIVRGDTEVDAKSLTLGDNALLHGNLITTHEFDINESKVSGKVIVNHDLSMEDKDGFRFLNLLTFFVYLVIGGLVLSLLAKKFTKKSSDFVIAKPFSTFLIGLISLFVFPILGVLLLITLVGIPLGLLVFLIYGLVIMVGLILGAIMIGKIVYRLLRKRNPKFMGIIIGALVFSIVMIVPLLGALFLVYFLLTGMGAVVRAPFTKKTQKISIPPKKSAKRVSKKRSKKTRSRKLDL